MAGSLFGTHRPNLSHMLHGVQVVREARPLKNSDVVLIFFISLLCLYGVAMHYHLVVAYSGR